MFPVHLAVRREQYIDEGDLRGSKAPESSSEANPSRSSPSQVGYSTVPETSQLYHFDTQYCSNNNDTVPRRRSKKFPLYHLG
jgi:hypothetical protein